MAQQHAMDETSACAWGAGVLIGQAIPKHVARTTSNTPQRRHIPQLVGRVRNGTIDPAQVLTHTEPLMNVVEVYQAFDTQQPGWIKVALKPPA